MEEEIATKTKFFKKIWISISKPSKYEELHKEGVWSSIKYFLGLIFLLSIILAIIIAFLKSTQATETITYLEENLPEITFKDNILKADKEISLNDKKIIENFGLPIIINTNINKEQAIKEYSGIAQENGATIIFLGEECVAITNKYKPENNNNEGIESYKYSDILSSYIKDTSKEYKKNDIIDFFKNRSSYSYYIAQLFTSNLLSMIVIYAFYAIIISGSLWLVTKITKNKWSYKKSIMNTLYASTLSAIIYTIYMILRYYLKIQLQPTTVISIFLIYIYVFLILKNEKERNVQKNEKG